MTMPSWFERNADLVLRLIFVLLLLGSLALCAWDFSTGHVALGIDRLGVAFVVITFILLRKTWVRIGYRHGVLDGRDQTRLAVERMALLQGMAERGQLVVVPHSWSQEAHSWFCLRCGHRSAGDPCDCQCCAGKAARP